MKRIKEIASKLFIWVVVFGLGFGLGYLCCSQKAENKAEVVEDTIPDVKLPTEKEKRIVTVDEVETKLEEIGELSTYSGEYEVTKETVNSRYLLDDIKIPGTNNTVHLECEGIVKVGYNLEDIGVNIDNKSHTICISLPEATVNANYVIWDTIKCIEKNSILHPIEFDQYQTLIDEIEVEGLSQVENKGIYEEAEENFENIIINFLSEMDDYTVKFL